jgi:hypothetical protein
MEFREVLRQIVQCLRSQLKVPGVTPFDPEDLRAWFHNITADDIRAVWEDTGIDRDHPR